MEPLLKTPPLGNLSILRRLVASYKLWHEFVKNFPRTVRFTLGEKIDVLFLKILSLIFTASRLNKSDKLLFVQKASLHLDNLKFLVQIAWEIKVLDDKKYIRISENLNEAGKMIGGWLKQIKTNSAV